MAGALASGRRLAIAPPVLCSIYRAFGYVASNPDKPADGMDAAHCPWHYFCGWLGVYFPWVYGMKPHAYFFPDRAPLIRFMKAKMVLKTPEWVSSRICSENEVDFYHFPASIADEDIEVIDDEDSVDSSDREFLISIRTASLPFREGMEFWREPYYPSRFAR